MELFSAFVGFIGGLFLGGLAGLFALPVVGTISEAVNSRSTESIGVAIFVFALFGTALGYALWVLLLSAPVAAGGLVAFFYMGKALFTKS